MSIFLRDLPPKIKLLPDDHSQLVVPFNSHLCQSLIMHWNLTLFDKDGHIFNAHNESTVGRSYSCSHIGMMLHCLEANIEYILNSFGLLLISTFFNATYQRYPYLAINALYKAFHFNHNFKGLFIIQALNRLAYAYFGLDYEEHRNKEDIKTRSVIEDFHSILASILVLPEKTRENEGEVWDEMPRIFMEYEHCFRVYRSLFIEHDDYTDFKTEIFGVLLPGSEYPVLSPFFSESKIKINSQYGEYRALLSSGTTIDTYLYKTTLAQPQNCTYQEEELKFMGIEKTFNYKEINVPYNPFGDWEGEEENDLKTKVFDNEYARFSFKLNNPLLYFPHKNSFFSSKNYNNINSDLIKVFAYPEELLALWEETGKKIYPYLETRTYSDPKLFDLQYNPPKMYEDVLLPVLNNKIRVALDYILSLRIIINDKEARPTFMDKYFSGYNVSEEVLAICLSHALNSSTFCSQHIEYFAKMREVRPPLKPENL